MQAYDWACHRHFTIKIQKLNTKILQGEGCQSQLKQDIRICSMLKTFYKPETQEHVTQLVSPTCPG